MQIGDAERRWLRRVPSWRRPEDGGFDRRRYTVTAIGHDVAHQFVTTHHYLGSYPADKLRYGLVDKHSDRLVGVAVFAEPASRRVLTKPFGERIGGSVASTLSRFVLLDEVPANAETFFLGAAFRDAAREHQLLAVVSFSDPMPRPAPGGAVLAGHVGGIYAAEGRGRYARRGTGRTLVFLPDWTLLSDRTAQKIRKGEPGAAAAIARLVGYGATPPATGEHMGRWLSVALAEVGAVRASHAGNHRWLFALGTRTQRTLVRHSIPDGLIADDDRPHTPDPEPVFRPVPMPVGALAERWVAA